MRAFYLRLILAEARRPRSPPNVPRPANRDTGLTVRDPRGIPSQSKLLTAVRVSCIAGHYFLPGPFRYRVKFYAVKSAICAQIFAARGLVAREHGPCFSQIFVCKIERDVSI